MNARAMRDLLAEFDRLERSVRAAPLGSPERVQASSELAKVLEKVGIQTSTALSAALWATLLGAAENDLALAVTLGNRFRTELRQRGLEVIPLGEALE